MAISSNSKPDHFYASSAALLLTMASPVRMEILELISEQEVTVKAIVEKIGLSQSATSQHLAKLREAHLVRRRRDEQRIFYSSNSTAVSKVLDTLREIFEAEAHEEDGAGR